MDIEDQSGLYDYLDLDGDGDAIFDIPEEVLEPVQEFGSESSSSDEHHDDDGSAELEVNEPTGSGGDGNVPVVITRFNKSC